MTLDKIKEFVKENKGIQHSFKFKGTRNQVDEFQGIITDLYPAIFIITLDDDKVKSFSYNDLLLMAQDIAIHANINTNSSLKNCATLLVINNDYFTQLISRYN